MGLRLDIGDRGWVLIRTFELLGYRPKNQKSSPGYQNSIFMGKSKIVPGAQKQHFRKFERVGKGCTLDELGAVTQPSTDSRLYERTGFVVSLVKVHRNTSGVVHTSK